MIGKTRLSTVASIFLLLAFSFEMITNLGNIAFWEDEGETIQYGKTILKYGYPSVFDGRSFILLDTNYHPQNYLRYTSPFLQFYISSAAIAIFKNPADTFLMRLPFALAAVFGVWLSWVWWRKLKISEFAVFLYSLFITTSVQLYLYWRQTRHYALQFPLSLGLLFSYINLDKRWAGISFVFFGFLFYHAYYPGFAGFYLGILLHAFLRKYFDKTYRLKPLIISTLILMGLNLPAAIYLNHFGQLPNNGYFHTLTAYLMDLNYFGYLKIAVLSIAVVVFMISLKRSLLALARRLLNTLFSAHEYSLSLFLLVIVFQLTLASFGAHNQRYISVLIPYLFLLTAVSWEKMITIIQTSLRLPAFGGSPPRRGAAISWIKLFSLLPLYFLISYSHPKFFLQLRSFITELQSNYYGPIEGIVNTVSGVNGLKRIDPNLPKQPQTLIATNFEDGAIYAYLDNRFLNFLAPIDKYKFGDRLPDWMIIRKDWGQEEYLNSFLQKGKYQKITTDYCDLKYQNAYLVRTHNFQTPPCPDSKLTLYKLTKPAVILSPDSSGSPVILSPAKGGAKDPDEILRPSASE